jgi:hypothetical protein
MAQGRDSWKAVIKEAKALKSRSAGKEEEGLIGKRRF